jgi:hypothetical protein
MNSPRIVSSLISILAVSSTLVIAQTGAKPPAQKPAATPAAKPSKVVLPPAVESAFKTAYPNATIKKVMKEKLKGKDVYEVESIDAGKPRDVTYYPDGVIAVLEDTITAAEVPAAVIAAIKKDHPKATVTRYEKVIEDGVTKYEVTLKGGKAGSAEYTPDGKPAK